MIKVTISGNPPSDNTLYPRAKHGRRFLSKRGKDYKQLARMSLNTKYKELNYKPFEGPINMSISVHFGDKRRRDVQGHLKALIDAFQGILYKDDSQIVFISASKHYDKVMPRAEVIIYELEETETLK